MPSKDRVKVKETVPDRGKWKGVPGKYKIIKRKGYSVQKKHIVIRRKAYTVPDRLIYIRLPDAEEEENLSSEDKK